MKMSPRPIQRKVSLLLKITLIVLSAAIFSWGLQYKLSLYENSSHPNPGKVAKLIQGDQSSKKTTVLHAQGSDRCPLIAGAYTVRAFQPPVPVRRNRPNDAPVLASMPFVSILHSVRPPPPAI